MLPSRRRNGCTSISCQRLLGLLQELVLNRRDPVLHKLLELLQRHHRCHPCARLHLTRCCANTNQTQHQPRSSATVWERCCVLLSQMYTRVGTEVLQSRLPANPVCRALHSPVATCVSSPRGWGSPVRGSRKQPPHITNSTQREEECRL